MGGKNMRISKIIKKTIKNFLINNYPVKQLISDQKIQLDYNAHIINQFIYYGGGEDYGIDSLIRRNLIKKFKATLESVESGTNLLTHIYLAQRIFSFSPEVPGLIAEFGSFKGASAANLSLACELVNRKLLLCDSFEGLPDDDMQLHVGMHSETFGYYKKGMFYGSLENVKENVEKFGDIQSCSFLKGFYSESLVNLKDPIVLAFMDVDLVSSTRDCLKYIWPLLVESGEIITDDAGDLDVVKIFFDDPWWAQNLQTVSPGFVGSGSGLLPCYPSLGYTKKTNLKNLKKVPHLYYPE
jgi:hypothetical protein